MFKTRGYHENGGLSRKYFEKFAFQKKNMIKNENLILCKFLQNKLYLFMSNLNLECFQLSFDVHIVHFGQKL